MKKNISLIVAAAVLIAGCAKKVAPSNNNTSDSYPKPVQKTENIKPVANTNPIENPLTGYLKAAGFSASNLKSEIGVPSEEVGFSFTPQCNGMISAITVRIPAVRQDLLVTIWDKQEVEKLVEEQVSITTPDKPYTFKLDRPLGVAKNKEYIISMNTSSAYTDYKSVGVKYPIRAGNILITNYCFNDGVEKRMPMRNNPNRFRGNISFNFQKIN